MRPSKPIALNLLSAATLAVLLGLSACSALQNTLSGDKLDYRSQATKTNTLDVPPDLTQLSRESRFQTQGGGTVSATAFQTGAAAPGAPGAPGASTATPTTTAALGTPATAVAPQVLGDMRIERSGNQRWLVTGLSPEQLWPQLRGFWEERGFTIASENAEAGVIETEWAENRAKVPTDVIRNTIGRVLDSLYSTGERDKFRTRIERTATGSEVYISHRGLEEVFVGSQKDRTMWTARPSDPSLEAEFLSRLMVKLGAKEEVARATVAAATPAQQPARARTLSGQPGAALQVDEPFDRAWRRVGVALDRSGFTVEDRDRTNGVYFVRYVDPKDVGKEEPGFLKRLFGGGKGEGPTGPNRYRIAVKGEASNTTVSVQNSQGGPEAGEIGQRIVALLVEDLK
jgi:outer membrane protein assembly factor BamC